MIVAVTAIVTVAVVVAVAVALVVVLAMAVPAAVVEVLAVAVAVVVVLAVAAAVVVVVAVAVAVAAVVAVAVAAVVAGASSVTSGRTWFLPCTLQKTKSPTCHRASAVLPVLLSNCCPNSLEALRETCTPSQDRRTWRSVSMLSPLLLPGQDDPRKPPELSQSQSQPQPQPQQQPRPSHGHNRSHNHSHCHCRNHCQSHHRNILYTITIYYTIL
jgi:hypothetical protein